VRSGCQRERRRGWIDAADGEDRDLRRADRGGERIRALRDLSRRLPDGTEEREVRSSGMRAGYLVRRVAADPDERRRPEGSPRFRRREAIRRQVHSIRLRRPDDLDAAVDEKGRARRAAHRHQSARQREQLGRGEILLAQLNRRAPGREARKRRSDGYGEIRHGATIGDEVETDHALATCR
jgi:hypothetical protein